jgi:solute carrier family 13 (sodium-dependent dicarboxylate transporter), member 2/3/5
MTASETNELGLGSVKWAGLWGGAIAFAILLMLPEPEGLSYRGWVVISVVVLMTIWWFTEALPISLTGVVPFMAFPLLGVSSSKDVAASYFSPVLFLLLGGFFLALAMEKWGLHKRVALFTLSHAKGGARAILLAVMSTAAFLSMFVSNSATTLAMMPVAMAIIAAVSLRKKDEPSADQNASDHEAQELKRFTQAMVLGIAYGATFGGFGTIIGSPGNAAAVAIYAKVYGNEISFNTWAAFGLPLVIISVPIGWLLLSRIVFPFKLQHIDSAAVRAAVGNPGKLTVPHIRLIVILVSALACWIGMPWLNVLVPALSDPHVSLAAALSLFIITAGGQGETRKQPLLMWEDTKQVPWHLLVMLGGGLALAEAINATDMSSWLQQKMYFANDFPVFWQLLFLATITLFVTEFATNTATAAAFLPASAALAGVSGIDPLMLGMVVALAANWGFMMPAGTPSLALAYGTGKLTVPQMVKAGAYMDVIGVVLILGIVMVVGNLIT